jgi:O-antigen/teichoic acid export membrane protein
MSAGPRPPTHGEAGASPPTPDLRAAAVQGVRWTFIARVTTEVALLGSLVLLARLIPPAEFGHYAVAIVASELAMLIPGEGVGTALVQRATVRREHLEAGLSIALLSALVLAALTLVAASIVVAPIFGSHTAELVRLTTPGFIGVAAATVPSAILRRRLAFRRLSLIDITTTGTRAVACVGLALEGLDGEALVLGGLVSGLVGTAMAWASAPPPWPRLRWAAGRELLSYGLPASLASISWVGFRNCDYAIVGAKLGAAQAGYYFRAYQLAVEYQKKVSLVTGQVGFPVLARAEGTAEGRALRGQMVRVLTVMLFPMLAVLALVAPTLVPWLFGSAWAPAVVPTQILAVGGAATLVIDMAGIGLMAAGRARALLGYGWAHFATYASAVFLVAPLGLAAVAVAAAVVHTFFLLVVYVLLFRGSAERPLRTLWNDVAPATISSVVLIAFAGPVSLALSAAGTPAFVQLAAVTLTAAPTYLVTLRACFPATWRSLQGVLARVWPGVRVPGATRRLKLADASPG